jgi:hypothetical protein
MVLHELVTNAAKYGSLSVPNGRVCVAWDRQNLDDGVKLVFEWRELGGPPVAVKASSGYGTSLIRDLIPHELGGKVDHVFAPDAVNCKIEIILEREPSCAGQDAAKTAVVDAPRTRHLNPDRTAKPPHWASRDVKNRVGAKGPSSKGPFRDGRS